MPLRLLCLATLATSGVAKDLAESRVTFSVGSNGAILRTFRPVVGAQLAHLPENMVAIDGERSLAGVDGARDATSNGLAIHRHGGLAGTLKAPGNDAKVDKRQAFVRRQGWETLGGWDKAKPQDTGTKATPILEDREETETQRIFWTRRRGPGVPEEEEDPDEEEDPQPTGGEDRDMHHPHPQATGGEEEEPQPQTHPPASPNDTSSGGSDWIFWSRRRGPKDPDPLPPTQAKVMEDLATEVEKDTAMIKEQVIATLRKRVIIALVVCVLVGILISGGIFFLSQFHEKRNDLARMRYVLAFAFLLVLLAGGGGYTLMESTTKTVGLIDGRLVGDAFLQLGQSWIDSFVGGIEKYKVGEDMQWNLVLLNPTASELVINSFGGPILINDRVCLIAKLAEHTVMPPIDDAHTRTTIPLRVEIKSTSFLGTLVTSHVRSALLGDILDITVDLEIEGTFDDRSFKVAFKGVIPFDLSSLPPLYTWPGSLSSPDTGRKVLEAITMGLRWKHEKSPPQVMVDFKALNVSGAIVSQLWILLSLLVVFFCVMCILLSFACIAGVAKCLSAKAGSGTSPGAESSGGEAEASPPVAGGAR